MNKSSQRRRYSILLVIMAIISLVVVAASAVYTGLLVHYRTHSIIVQADARLLESAELSREILGADYHDRIVDAESVSKEEFSRIVAKNDDLCRRLNLQYLWSVLLVNGRVVFTSATHSDLNNPDSSCASFFETHRDPEAFTPALQPELKPAFCSFKNEWGEGRQVLIPHKDARGRTYIFGASVQMDDLNAVVSQTILDSIGIGFGILCGALLLALMLVRSFPKPIAELTAAAGRMATGDLDVSLPLARISELQSLSRSLDEMRQGLKKQLAQLLESEKNYRELVENANSIILRLEPDGTITFFNDFAEKFFGFSKNEILGKAVFGTIVPETDSTNRDLRAMVLDIARNPEKYAKNETENMCKDGSRVWISWSNKAICDAAGTVCEILCVGNDVTERKRAVEALAKEREDLLAVFDALPEFVYLQAPDYSIRYANHSFKQLFGEPGDRFCYACMQNRQSPCETCPTFEVFQTKQPQCWEWAADNQVYMIHVVPFADIDGSMLVLAIGFDITDLKRAEEALIRSEAMLAQSQQIANIGSWDLDVAANRLIWSDETYRIFGLAPQEFVATYETFLDLVHPDDRAMVDEMYSRSLHEGLDSYEIEHRLVRRSTGEIRHVHEKCVHQRNAAGEVIRSRGMVQDITERKRAQEALIESEERFKNMFELHGSIMLLIDPESGFVVDANEAAVSYYGYSKSKLITMKIDEINVLSPQQVKAELELALHEERNYFIFQHRLASGEERTVEVHSWPIIFMDRQILFSIIHDITERRLAEEALQAKNEELIRFNYTVSHDLKSPLVTIKTFLGYLEQDMAKTDTKHVAQDLGFIHTAADRMNALLEELLDLSRIGLVVNPPVEAPLQTIVQEALDLVAGRIAERKVRVVVGHEPLMLYGDRVRLVEVFQNLVDNAVKFMGEQTAPLVEIGGEIRLGETVCFVRDNGMGIDPRHKGKLFGIFEKLDAVAEGTGLGLALAKRIVEVYGGRIWVESEGLGKGACFYFTVPVNSSESGVGVQSRFSSELGVGSVGAVREPPVVCRGRPLCLPLSSGNL